VADHAGFYERECRFYEELAAEAGMRVPRCIASVRSAPGEAADMRRRVDRLASKPPWLGRLAFLGDVLGMALARRRYALLLEDLSGLTSLKQTDGCTPQDAERALASVARMHARHWQGEVLDRPWLVDVRAVARIQQRRFRRQLPSLVARYGAAIGEGTRRHLEWIAEHGTRLAQWVNDSPPTLVHGDFRLDNLFFDGDEVVAVDWQACARAPAAFDVAYFLGGNLKAEPSSAELERLLDGYLQRLHEAGVCGYAREQLRQDYERALLLCLWVLAPVVAVVIRLGGAELFDAWMPRLLRSAERIERLPTVRHENG